MNTVCHIEISVTDLDRAETFYAGVFGWTFRAFTPTMRVFAVGDAHVGGLALVDAVVPGRSPSVWLQVASADEALARAEAYGGRVLSGKQEVPGVGFSADFEDPDGNYVGVLEYA